jgi:glycosyltransferase involved in cell wall biosynthesis
MRLVKISVIIPNLNKSKFIKATLQSIIAQSYSEWEAIVVDDGSTDGSQAIVAEYSEIDSRIRFIARCREPQGGSVCRNIGIENSKGSYLMFLDSDDLLAPNCIEQRIIAINSNTDADFLVFSGATFYKKVGDSQSFWIPPKNGDYLYMFLAHILPWHTTSPIWKKSFIERKLKGFDETYSRLQDVEFHTRALMEPAINFKIISGIPDFFYRIDESRKLVAPFQFVENFINAVELYYNLIKSQLIEFHYSTTYIEALNGTIQSAYIAAQINYDNKKITIHQRNELFRKVNRIHPQNTVFNLYLMGLKINIHNIKGYNWIFNMILTRKFYLNNFYLKK